MVGQRVGLVTVPFTHFNIPTVSLQDALNEIVVDPTNVDDTSTINAALAAIAAGGGGTVRLKPSRYFVNGDIVVPPNCRLVGNEFGIKRTVGGLNDYSQLPYAIYMDPVATVRTGDGTNNGGTDVSGIYIVNKLFLTPPQTTRDLVNQVKAFSGVGITTAGNDSHVHDISILGFGTGIIGAGRQCFERIWGDCTNGIQITGAGDFIRIKSIEITYYTTIGFVGSDSFTVSITGVANNGAGLYRLTVDSNTFFQTGDVLNIYGPNTFNIANLNVLNNRWTITVIDNTHVDLLGSSFGGVTTTADTTSGHNYFVATSINNIAPGQGIAGTGIPVGATVTNVSRYTKTVWISAACTHTLVANSLTFTDPVYANNFFMTLTASARFGGTGLSIAADGGDISDCVMQAFDVGYYLGNSSHHIGLMNCQVDNLATYQDPNTVGLWLDGSAHSNLIVGNFQSVNTPLLYTANVLNLAHMAGPVSLLSHTGVYATCAEIIGTSGLILCNCLCQGRNFTVHDSAVTPPGFFMMANVMAIGAVLWYENLTTGLAAIRGSNVRFGSGSPTPDNAVGVFESITINTIELDALKITGKAVVDNNQGCQILFTNTSASPGSVGQKRIGVATDGSFRVTQGNPAIDIFKLPDKNLTMYQGDNRATRDRGIIGGLIQGTAKFLTAGDAQTRSGQTLIGTTSSVTTITLTTDGLAVTGANAVHVPQNTSYTLRILLIASNVTNPGSYYSWTLPDGVLTRENLVTTTAFAGGTPVIHAIGTTAGTVVAATADTTLGNLKVAYTSPNTDIWRVVARVDTVEVQVLAAVTSVVLSGTGIVGGAGAVVTGTVVTVTLNFNVAVTVVGGPPTMALTSGGTATYNSGSGTTALAFTYTVGATDFTTALRATSFSANGATIQDGGGSAADVNNFALTPTGVVTVN